MRSLREQSPIVRSRVLAKLGMLTMISFMGGSSPVPLVARAQAQAQAVEPARAEPEETVMDAAALERVFRNPPADARPRVWWHWMNGNVTKDGIRKDLAWMRRIGIAGFQVFDADIATPQIVDHRLSFMSPEWKDAFRFAASEADRLGLEMAIASSPGFSVTGGPWVKPEDAMKKIAWSETFVEGGRPFRGKLTLPPPNTGPFQDSPPFDLLTPLTGEEVAAPFYRDERVFAHRVSGIRQPIAVHVSVNGEAIDGALLSDGSYRRGLSVPKSNGGGPTIIELTLDRPQVVRSLTFAARGAIQLFKPGITLPLLEVSTDGVTWKKLATLIPGATPTTISFAPVEAKRFRVVLTPIKGVNGYGVTGAAPGFDLSVYDQFKSLPDLELLELRLSNEAQIDRWEAKAGFAPSPGQASSGADIQEAGVATRDVIDLTGRMRADGTLDWTPPPGHWRVIRMGWSLTGTTNHPATPEATGLEVDKIDADAVRRYLETYLGMYRDAAGADLIGKRGVRALVTDSTEAGSFNWTPRLLEHFRRLRGYDPRPWLPTLTGVIVESRARSDAFLADFRRTIGDLYATEHYGTIAKIAHQYGMKVYGESLEGASSGPGDDLDMRRFADVPMGAQWTFAADEKPLPIHEADMRGAASVAHFYGRRFVAAEALTSIANPWGQAPQDLRRAMDLVFATGINRPVIHTSVHVPRDDMIPGLSLWVHGQYFNRMDTWAEMAGPWVDYIARSSALLQAGRPVADIAYFYGEEGSIGSMSSSGLPADLPTDNGYDFVSANAVREFKVDGSDLVAPSGVRYRALYLSKSVERMTLPTLRRIATLVEKGATVIGDAPQRPMGLQGDALEYARLIGKLWPGGKEAVLGRGRVIAGRDLKAALDRIGVASDFGIAAPAPDARINFVHRHLADGDVYFVAHRAKAGGTIEARFRVTGKAPEIWRADEGTMKPASYRIEGDHTIVPLALDAEDSVFVVFRKDTTDQSRVVPAEHVRAIADIQGPWNVGFQPGRGAPASITLERLSSLTTQAEPGIKYFSGVATYTKTIEAPRSWTIGQSLAIDLGAIGDVAEVWVNGRLAGTAWRAPYRVDIGGLMKPGANRLEVRVANLWVNRLIGDQQPGAKRVTYTATPTYRADAPLRPSGLIGPVQLLTTGLADTR